MKNFVVQIEKPEEKCHVSTILPKRRRWVLAMLIAYAKEKTLQKEKKTVTLRTRMGDIPGNQRYLADTMSWKMCMR